mmetsp:Transcript_35701/g.52352  ORF Transcript_35701/g.52352 Transcript_35701/m.52352 type:complete len:612 (+) Transcript_35701:171-2006(+)|eukprot:CAMPEP_0195528842 /NCGR_PEP_ID=MMETSP0794_2-20130614/31169_1 /TAXON_ID=515487 /ORGANISM="Stephanopyxis turris, Strain CCMP 815" /LENGTH=611 /DNA_ID=CAMNT_0040660049 /DNA_START=171 /DNA_END=2006 /DNA_ORIENTATION=+
MLNVPVDRATTKPSRQRARVSARVLVASLILPNPNFQMASAAFTLVTSGPFTSHRSAFLQEASAFCGEGTQRRSHKKSLLRLCESSTSLSSSVKEQEEEEEEDGVNLAKIASTLTSSLRSMSDRIKNQKVSIQPTSSSSSSSSTRLGLFASKSIQKGDAVLSIPYDDDLVLSPTHARNTVFKNDLPQNYNGWTGDLGYLAMLILHEYARAFDATSFAPKRNTDEFMKRWAKGLPTPAEMKYHPMHWTEEQQEELQSSSTKKIYRALDDADEDGIWCNERIWSKDRGKFPEIVNSMECFTPKGFRWALSLAMSRSVFVDGELRIVPVVDFANHADYETEEIGGGSFGAFGTTKGVQIVAGKDYNEGEEVFVSYGPKSAAEYLLEHGMIPPATATSTCVAELTFEIDQENDVFADDKLDILEFETFGGTMEPTQSFDIVAAAGQDGEPDPSMVQFLRLIHLGGTDAFLLESIFRKEVWGFMSVPVSEKNELSVVDAIITACDDHLEEMDSIEGKSSKEDRDVFAGTGLVESGVAITGTNPDACCATVRMVERKALQRTKDYMQREREALDLKEYYQERRLKDLGLDSQWEEDDLNPDVGWGQTRAPGGGDLDW